MQAFDGGFCIYIQNSRIIIIYAICSKFLCFLGKFDIIFLMKFLFFDIECSDGSHICSFGYVLTDENFKILEKDDLLINPKWRFRLGRYGGGEEVHLAYPEAEFKKAPTFPKRYAEISEFFKMDDVRIFGHAVDNDAKFLNNACARYGLPYINFEYFDTQLAFKEFSPEKKIISLEGIMSELGIIAGGDLHRSADDAEMSMLTLKSICEEHDCSACDLIELWPQCTGLTKDGNIFRRQCGTRKFYSVFFCRVGGFKPQNSLENPEICGKRVCISAVLEKAETPRIWTLAQRLIDSGGKYTKKTSSCDYFVKAEKDTVCSRLEMVKQAQSKGKKIKIITVEEFATLLGCDWETVEKFDIAAYVAKHPIKREKKPINYVDKNKGATIGDGVRISAKKRKRK